MAMLKIILAACLCILTSTFVLRAPNFNVMESMEIVKFAAVAFCDDKCIVPWTCKTTKEHNLTDILYIDHPITKVHGFVGYRPDVNQIIAAFRGSHNWQNWVQDGNFQRIDYPDCFTCQIHAGFYADYLSIEKSFRNHVASILKKYSAKASTMKIICTGHSLGAAIAAISALSLKVFFPSQHVTIHNYGQPRIGNKPFSNFMAKKVDQIYRVVHNKDLVPHLPPDLPEFSYHHAAYQVFFNQDLTSYKVCNSSGQDSTCSNKFFPNYDPNDHDHYFMYISRVQC